MVRRCPSFSLCMRACDDGVCGAGERVSERAEGATKRERERAGEESERARATTGGRPTVSLAAAARSEHCCAGSGSARELATRFRSDSPSEQQATNEAADKRAITHITMENPSRTGHQRRLEKQRVPAAASALSLALDARSHSLAQHITRLSLPAAQSRLLPAICAAPLDLSRTVGLTMSCDTRCGDSLPASRRTVRNVVT